MSIHGANIKIDVKIKQANKWKEALAKIADNFGGTGVMAGVTKGSNTTSSSGTSVAEYAFFNEYGAPGAHIPVRAFMRTTVNEHSNEWADLFAKYVAAGDTQNPSTIRRAWTMVGRAMANDIVGQISSNMPPENAESTKKRKEKKVTGGKRKEGEPAVTTMTPGTLQDTGLLINRIAFELIEKE